MKILFDYQSFDNRFGGISRYHYELSKGLLKNNHEVEISALFTENEYLLSDNSFNTISLIGHREFKGRHRVKKILNSINQQKSIRDIEKGDYDIFHPTYYDPYFLKKLHKPFVLTVHDFVHEKFISDQVKEINNKKLLIEKANSIIAISENTKNDILSYYSIPEKKISVIYHGYNKPNIEEYLPNIYGKYILFVGRRDGYKNFDRFLLAISRLLKDDDSIKLICTGNPFSARETEAVHKLQITQSVIQVSANENQLNSLYKHAIVFVFPSLYEGFGMPIFEAYANDCAVCLSNTSCFPEIGQSAAMYFDPYDEISIFETVKNVIYNDQLRRTLVEEGNKRLMFFSWDNTVKKTLEVYEQLL